MNILKAYNLNGQKVVDSREVAEMVGRSHKELLRTINTYIGYLKGDGAEGENLSGVAQRNFAPGDFFIESIYTDSNNQQRPNFWITKKGCDMIANKLTGKKGVLFTAAYVTAFDEMNQQIAEMNCFAPKVSPGGLAMLINATRQIMIESGSSYQDVRQMAKDLYQTWNVPVPPVLHKEALGQLSFFESSAVTVGIDASKTEPEE